jgi:hypothetical protein
MATSIPFLWRRARWALPTAAAIVAMGAFALAVVAHKLTAAAIRDETFKQGVLRMQFAESARPIDLPCALTTSYAQALPSSVSIDRFVQSLQDSSHAFGVELVSVSSEPHMETARALAGVDVNVSLHGAYPGIKSALAKAFSRFPTAVLRRLRLRKDGQGMVVEEASAQFVMPLRPLRASNDCTVAPKLTPPSASSAQPK